MDALVSVKVEFFTVVLFKGKQPGIDFSAPVVEYDHLSVQVTIKECRKVVWNFLADLEPENKDMIFHESSEDVLLKRVILTDNGGAFIQRHFL